MNNKGNGRWDVTDKQRYFNEKNAVRQTRMVGLIMIVLIVACIVGAFFGMFAGRVLWFGG